MSGSVLHADLLHRVPHREPEQLQIEHADVEVTLQTCIQEVLG
jgi:hypothetical protein